MTHFLSTLRVAPDLPKWIFYKVFKGWSAFEDYV